MREVYDFIEQLSDDEYLRRLNACIAVYNRIATGSQVAAQHEQMLLNIVTRVREIANRSPSASGRGPG